MRKQTSLFIRFLLFLFPFVCHAQGPVEHPDGEFISVNNARLWVETKGDGMPLFLIAGGPGSSHLYLHSFDTLAAEFKLVFLDNFGRGKSDTAQQVTEYSIARDVEDIEAIRRTLGFDSIAVLGHSYGAVVAQLYALKYGNHCNRLIVANGFYSGKMWQENDDNSNRNYAENAPEMWERIMQLRAKGIKSSDKRHYELYFNLPNGLLYSYNPENAHYFPDDPAYPNEFNVKVYYQIVGPDGDFVVGNDMAKFDVTAELKKLKMPVLVIAGRYDRVSVPKMNLLYKKYCPLAKFVMFEKSGHSPQVEEPEKMMKTIREFMVTGD